MPKESKIITELPKSILGEFLEINFGENSVEGQLKTVSKISDKRYLIESVDVMYIDSLNWANQNMSTIKKVNFKNNILEIVTSDKIHTRELTDTLSSKPKRKEYELDFEEGYFYDEFYDNELYEASKRKCQLQLKNGKYYLNIEYFKQYWMTSRVEIKERNLILNTTNFSLQNEHKIRFEQLKAKYNFEKIRFEDNRNLDWNYYLANSDDTEMEKILNEDFFGGFIWYKVNSECKKWKFIPIGAIIFLSLIYYFKRTNKRKTTENIV